MMKYMLTFSVMSRTNVLKDKFYFKNKTELQNAVRSLLKGYFKVNEEYYKNRINLNLTEDYIQDMVDMVVDKPIYLPYRKFTLVNKCKGDQIDKVKLGNIDCDSKFIQDFKKYHPTKEKKYHYIILSSQPMKYSDYNEVYNSMKWFIDIKYNQRDYDCDILKKIKEELNNETSTI